MWCKFLVKNSFSEFNPTYFMRQNSLKSWKFLSKFTFLGLFCALIGIFYNFKLETLALMH